MRLPCFHYYAIAVYSSIRAFPATLELESGCNDPMAILLVTALIGLIMTCRIQRTQYSMDADQSIRLGTIIWFCFGQF